MREWKTACALSFISGLCISHSGLNSATGNAGKYYSLQNRSVPILRTFLHREVLVLVANRAGAGDLFLDRWRVTRVGDFACTGDHYFQGVGDCNVRVASAGGGNFSSFSLQSLSRQLAGAGHIDQEAVDTAIQSHFRRSL